MEFRNFMKCPWSSWLHGLSKSCRSRGRAQCPQILTFSTGSQVIQSWVVSRERIVTSLFNYLTKNRWGGALPNVPWLTHLVLAAILLFRVGLKLNMQHLHALDKFTIAQVLPNRSMRIAVFLALSLTSATELPRIHPDAAASLLSTGKWWAQALGRFENCWIFLNCLSRMFSIYFSLFLYRCTIYFIINYISLYNEFGENVISGAAVVLI